MIVHEKDRKKYNAIQFKGNNVGEVTSFANCYPERRGYDLIGTRECNVILTIYPAYITAGGGRSRKLMIGDWLVNPIGFYEWTVLTNEEFREKFEEVAE